MLVSIRYGEGSVFQTVRVYEAIEDQIRIVARRDIMWIAFSNEQQCRHNKEHRNAKSDPGVCNGFREMADDLHVIKAGLAVAGKPLLASDWLGLPVIWAF